MPLQLSERVKGVAKSRFDRLTADKNAFMSYVALTSPAFGGPAQHFYKKTMDLVSQHKLRILLPSELLAESIYATLTAWDMHRMGPNGAKLKDFGDFRKGLEACGKDLLFLSDCQLSELGGYMGKNLLDKLGDAFSSMSVMKTESKLVGNSKTLHFLLPKLVPPIDREYTLKFFLDTKMIAHDEREVFLHVVEQCRSIATVLKLTETEAKGIDPLMSVPKLIDSAIVGFVIKELKAHKEAEEAAE